MPERQRQLSHLLATTKDLKMSNLTAVHIQTCQGPEMKMRETVRHSGEGAIFFGGGALLVMRPLSKFSDLFTFL